MIRDILKKATKAATTWVGNAIGGPTGGAIGERVGDFIGDSLFSKSGGGGGGDMIDTRVKAPRLSRFGVQTRSPGMSGSARGYADVVNPETLYAAWDRRLSKYYTDKYKIARTVKGKVI
jgi:hypothetical protein